MLVSRLADTTANVYLLAIIQARILLSILIAWISLVLPTRKERVFKLLKSIISRPWLSQNINTASRNRIKMSITVQLILLP